MRLSLPLLALGALAAPLAGAQPRVVASLNPAGLDGDGLLTAPTTFGTAAATNLGVGRFASLQSVAFGPDGTAYHTTDLRPSGGAIVVVDGAGAAATSATIGDGTRWIGGASTGLNAPKGLVHARLASALAGGVAVSRQDVLIVADFGARNVKVFAAGASGNVAPLVTFSDFGTPAAGATRSVWDVAYDEAANRLYVATTDGVVAVYDNVSVLGGATAPSRVITPTDGTSKVSINLHGIVYVPGSDMLLLTDVGSATNATDGQVFTIASASTASGNTPVRYRNSGAATLLGNPVDAEFTNGMLYVAEKSNDRILRFDGILGLTGTAGSAASASATVTKPESVSLFGSDLYATTNPDGTDNDLVQRFTRATLTPTIAFTGLGTVSGVEGLTVMGNGDAYINVDGRPGYSGGFIVVGSSAMMASGTPVGLGRTLVQGPATGLAMPKGNDVDLTRDWVLVADVGATGVAPSVRVFSTSASGNAAPRFSVTNLGMTAANAPRAVWDIDYDRSTDRLFGAGTDGVVVVFDAFSTTLGAGGPSRTIVPTDGTSKISVNLHGIAYAGGRDDVLLLTDVGSAASATDGQVFTIASASTASGNTGVRFRNAGPVSMLGNPVDLVYDGMAAYVAEKSNDRLIRYDNLAALTGSVDNAGSAMIAANKPEGVALSMPFNVASEAAPRADDARLALFPNPASSQATVRLTLPADGEVTVAVYDALSRRVALRSVQASAGAFDHTVDTQSLASGAYFVRVTAAGQAWTLPLTVLR